jgi:hypothetical protein
MTVGPRARMRAIAVASVSGRGWAGAWRGSCRVTARFEKLHIVGAVLGSLMRAFQT